MYFFPTEIVEGRSVRWSQVATQTPKRLIRWAFLAMVAVSLLAEKRAAFAQTPGAQAGTMTAIAGSVQLQRGQTTSDASLGMAVDVADHIGTGNPGHAIVTLIDESRLEIGALSNVVVDRYLLAPPGGRTTTSLSLVSGVMRSFVSHSAGLPHFEVNTPNAVAAARGTTYDTAYTEGGTRPTYGDCTRFTDVSVDEGFVAVTNRGNPGAGTVEVPAGYEVTVACEQSPTQPAPLGLTGAIRLDSSGAGSGAGGLPPPAGAAPPSVPPAPPPVIPPAPN
jgi:hypothetical protein